MLTALVAIAPMAILLVHLFFVWMVSTNRGGWHQDLPVPYSIIPTMGPIMPMVIPNYWTKGPFMQNGHCCNSTNSRPVGSFVFGVGVNELRGAAPTFAMLRYAMLRYTERLRYTTHLPSWQQLWNLSLRASPIHRSHPSKDH
jgi:hypothetical protein